MANGLPFGMTADSLHVGMGYGTRKNAEDCFLFRVGSPKRLARDVHEIILAPVREHSRKPDEAIERIEPTRPTGRSAPTNGTSAPSIV